MARRVWVLPSSWPSEPLGEDGRTSSDTFTPVAEVVPKRRLPRLRPKAKKPDTTKASTHLDPPAGPKTGRHDG
jgi:hypothetical protein